MNSIDIKSLLIGALFTAVVFLSTGWQQSIVFPKSIQIDWPTGKELDINIDEWPRDLSVLGKFSADLRGHSDGNRRPIYIKD